VRRASRWGLALLGAALAVTAPASAQTPEAPKAPAEEPSSWWKQLQWNAFVSAAFVYNTNRPESGTNTYRAFDFDHNSIKLDVAEVVVQRAATSPGEVGFRADLTAGSSVPRVAASAGLFRDASGNGEDFDLQQAYVTYVAAQGLTFTAGKFAAPYSAEVIEGYDGWNWSYSRGLVFSYACPFNLTGLKGTYAFSDQVSASLFVTNGWDNVKDNNSGKSVGAQLVVLPSKQVDLYLAYLGGPENPDSHDVRHIFDLVATLRPASGFAVTLNYLYGTEEGTGVGAGNARFQGLAGHLRVEPASGLALNFRGEWFEDRDGIRTGTIQKLTSLAVTPEIALGKLVLRAEYRWDRSTEDVFRDRREPSSTQSTLALNTLVSF
jgi:hypothetical protein